MASKKKTLVGRVNVSTGKFTPVKATGAVKVVKLLDNVELDFMYESKSSEYVFGAEVGDGFITISVPKDRFANEPKALIVKAEIIE